jgi:3-oxoacyl-[acyl-carrier-protein] synthase-1
MHRAPQRPLPVTAFSACNAIGADTLAIREALRHGTGGLETPNIALPFDTCAGRMDTRFEPLQDDLKPWCTRMARMSASLVRGLGEPLARARARWDARKIGVILGTSTAGAESTDFKRQHTYGALLHVVSTVAGVKGPAWMVSTACTSSSKPLASAARLIRQGVLDAAIVGGFDTLCAMTLRGFHSLGALSNGRCTPFSENRDGISIGEGGALLLLERDGHGPALLKGVGESSDAYHISAPHPEGLGAQIAMRRALEEAGLAPHDIDHINAHGTGTKLNDAVEAKAIQSLFAGDIPVVSTKGFTGHTLGAAGATEAVFAIMAIEDQRIPGSLGADPRDPAISLTIPTHSQSHACAHVLSNSFAFGGNNVSVIMGAP